MDPNLAVVVAALVLLAGLVSAGWGAALYHLSGRAAAELALAHDERDEALALAQHRLELLDDAKALLAEAEADGRSAIERRAALDAALRAAPPGGRLDAVERLLLEQAAARRARRAAEAGAAPARAPAAVDRAHGGPGAPRVDGADA